MASGIIQALTLMHLMAPIYSNVYEHTRGSVCQLLPLVRHNLLGQSFFWGDSALTSRFLYVVVLAAVVGVGQACTQRPKIQELPTEPFAWSYYGADAASTKFAPLAQINAANFEKLQVVWKWPADNADLGREGHRCTPLFVDGVLYTGTPRQGIFAIDAATGRQLWHFKLRKKGPHRGIAYWSDGEQERILFGNNKYHLYSINAKTGRPDSTFGRNGRVDLYQHMRRKTKRNYYSLRSAPLICGDVVIVGSTIRDLGQWGPPPEFMPPGDVTAYDVRTGEHLWTFHTVPQKGEFGVETWENESWKNFGSANAWAALTADLEMGYVYLPLSTPTHDFYGGERPGANLFGESLVCLDARTGERIWHYQIVHHGLWDYDLAAPPVLLDVEQDGKVVKAVAQITKQGFCFVFNRLTGEPLWPIEERPVPPASGSQERAFPTQPFPTKPAAFDRQGFSRADVIDFTPQLKSEALELLSDYDFGPLYTPPSRRGILVLPGLTGGADWVGAAADPQRGLLYVPSHTVPYAIGIKNNEKKGFSAIASWTEARLPGPRGLPLTKPPYGRITAIDLNSGTHRWMSPVGKGPVEHPALSHLDLPDLGWPTRIYVMATPQLVYAASERPTSMLRLKGDYFMPSEAYLRAYDPEKGSLVGQVKLPANAQGNPITYAVGGRQYVVVPMDSRTAAGLVALALPRPGDVPLALGLERDDADHPAYYQGANAIEAGDVEGLTDLLEKYPKLVHARGFLEDRVKPRDYHGATLLHLIAGDHMDEPLPTNIVELATSLLAAGADPNAITDRNQPVLALVLASDQARWAKLKADLVKTLLQGGANPDLEGGRLLWLAVNQRANKVAEVLIEAGAPYNLRLAAAINRPDLMQQFIGQDGRLSEAAGGLYRPGGKGKYKQQRLLDEALAYASYGGAVAAAEWLLAQGAKINALVPNIARGRDRGATALHRAVAADDEQMVRFLLERGADISAKDSQHNNTPRGWAEYYGYAHIAAVLKRAEKEQP